MRKLTREEVKVKIEDRWGENRWGFNQFIYNGMKIFSIFICFIHGMFKTTPGHLIRGHGCKKCGYIKNSNNRRKTNKKFIKDARKIHGKKYSYKKVIYKGWNVHVIITCPKHGDFSPKSCVSFIWIWV